MLLCVLHACYVENVHKVITYNSYCCIETNAHISLERAIYPPEAYVDHSTFDAYNICQLDSMCWTRYEKKGAKKKEASKAVLSTKLDAIKAFADMYVRDGIHSTKNFGSSDILAVKLASEDYTRISLLQFKPPKDIIQMMNGKRAKLRLYVTLVDPDIRERKITVLAIRSYASGFKLGESIATWDSSEETLERNLQDDSNIASSSLIVTQEHKNQWVEVDISDLISDDSTIFLALLNDRHQFSSGTSLVEFASRETSNGPRIVFEDILAPPTPAPSNLCTRIWDDTTLTKSDIEYKIKYVADGCKSDDEKFRKMLLKAHDQCIEEIIAESMAISIIKQPSAVYTHVSVDW